MDKTEGLSLVASQDTRGKENSRLSHSQHSGAGKKSPPPAQLTYQNEANSLLRSVFSTWRASMKLSTKNRLIKVYFAIPDLHIVSTIRTGTHPGLVVNRRPLTTKVRQRHQIPLSAFLTLWERTSFQVPPPQLVYSFIPKRISIYYQKFIFKGTFADKPSFSGFSGIPNHASQPQTNTYR